jgi:hypothetical protein
MDRRSCFDFEIASIDAEFALRPKLISGDRHLRRKRDRARHSVKSEIPCDVQVVLSAVNQTVRNDTQRTGSAAENRKLFIEVLLGWT